MRNIFNFLIFVIICLTFSNKIFSQVYTPGTLTFTVKTSSAGGGYAPSHVMAIWITTSSGTFVKTKLRRAVAQVAYLTHWNSSSSGNVTDATTGATMSNHNSPNSPYTITWNGTDVNGNVVADGTYNLCIELTDKNATGNYSTFTFVKGTTQQLQNPANQPSFSNMTLNWVPTPQGINANTAYNYSSSVYPNPFNKETNISFNLKNSGSVSINIYSVRGDLVKVLLNEFVDEGTYNLKWDGSDNNNNKVSEGVYYYTISTAYGSYTGKFVYTK